MSLVQFLGIYYSHHVGIDVAVVGLGFLFESLARGLLAPMFGALSDRIGRRALLLASALSTAVILPCFLMSTVRHRSCCGALRSALPAPSTCRWRARCSSTSRHPIGASRCLRSTTPG